MCLGALGLRESRPVAPEHHILTQLVAGIAHIAHRPGLRRIVLTVAAALLVVGFAETAIFAVLQQGIHKPPAFLGVLSAGQGVGAIAGAVAASAVIRRIGDARTVALGILLFGAGDAFFLIPAVGPVLVGIGIAGAGLSFAVVGFGTAVQLRTPVRAAGSRVLGRRHAHRDAADCVDRGRRRDPHGRRLPCVDRGDGGRVRALRHLSGGGRCA